jgi:hypothetical protein
MAIDVAVLDELQEKYKTAVDEWVAAIRHEEQLASFAEHSETEIDKWEEAARQEETSRAAAKQAKAAYEGALRQEFFNF